MQAVFRPDNAQKEADVWPMKKFKRMAIGMVSSFLALAGMVRAAEKIEPLSHSLGNKIDLISVESPGENCTCPCNYYPRNLK